MTEDQLHREVSRMARELADKDREIERLRAERDEARREVCELRCNPPERFVGLPHELAQVNGWDCYKENTDEK
jgi:cell division protein FtsB